MWTTTSITTACLLLLSAPVGASSEGVAAGTSGEGSSFSVSDSDTRNNNLRSLQVVETDIPHHFWFTYSHNIIQTRRPRSFYENVLGIVDKYQEAWGTKDDSTVNFLDDEACAREIELAEPRLLSFFQEESEGKYRGDICRNAVLYLYGGYYHDIDIDLVEPYIPAEGESFVSTESCGGGCFFSSFIAVAPKHPIMKHGLQQLLEVYENDFQDMEKNLVGPITLHRAYSNLKEEERGKVKLLQEIELKEGDEYPEVERQDGWGRCNFAIHDPEGHKVYYYARFPGSGGGCYIHKHKIQVPKITIDHRIWMTHGHHILKQEEQDALYDNVKNTIDRYRDEWYQDMAPVNFLTDQLCGKYLRKAKPELLPFFEKEEEGRYRGDMCRISAMYLYGGFYFDVDAEVVDPWMPSKEDGVDPEFISVRGCGGGCFYSSFIGAVKKHPILEKALDLMLEVYQKGEDTELLGNIALANAYETLSKEQKEKVYLLEEKELEDGDYPNLPRQRGVGHCNWIIHDPNREKVYFFDRFVGYGPCQPIAESSD